MVMREGEIPLHELLPPEKQDAFVRLEGVLDELLVRHDFPADVQQIIVARVGEWVNKWREKGVHRSHTFAEFQEQSVPGFLQEAFFMLQHHALRNRRNGSDNSLMAPGKKDS